MGEEGINYFLRGYTPERGYTPKRRTMREIKSDFNKYQQKLYLKKK